MFVATRACRDKHTFVATKDVFCRDKHVSVSTKMTLVAVPACDTYQQATEHVLGSCREAVIGSNDISVNESIPTHNNRIVWGKRQTSKFLRDAQNDKYMKWWVG